MDFIRQLPLADYLRIKQAWRDLVKACGGPEKVAELTRAGNRGLISQYSQPHCMDRFPPLDVVMDLEAECGVPYVTRVLADMLGLDIVPRQVSRSNLPIRSLIAAVTRESADLTARFLEASEDNRLSADERTELRREAEEAIEKLNELRLALTIEPTLRAVG
jgi:hypothetical protein